MPCSLRPPTGRVPLEPEVAEAGTGKGTLPTLCKDACAPRSQAFNRGGQASFILRQLPDVGTMQQLEIGHDNSGVSPGWHLAWVRVTNLTTGATGLFKCNQWLAKNEADKKIIRLLDVEDVLQAPPTSATELVQQQPQQTEQLVPASPPPPAPMPPMQVQSLSPFTMHLVRSMGGTVGQPGYKVRWWADFV